MQKFRKKPVVIEAVQWNGRNFDEVMNFMGENCGHKKAYEDYESLALKTGEIQIKTIEGTMTANAGDWIIKGVNSEFYPCKPDIFEKTYEGVSETTDDEETDDTGGSAPPPNKERP